jgi:ribulose-phosphate 3-epimerase
MKIVPAVLTDKREEFISFFNQAESFCQQVQIDIMDGKFVPSRSILKKDLEGLKARRYAEAHLMAEDPLSWLDAFRRFGAKRIIFHFEIKDDKDKIISQIRARNLEVGLAINPPTKVEEFRHLVDRIDTVLFMAVYPGFYGAEFVPQVLDKIKEFKRLYPQKPIGIDGGIKLDNVKEIGLLGIDFICVGSAIFNTANPAQAYKDFVHTINIG